MTPPRGPLCLNAGCGLAYRPGFINFDFRPSESKVDVAADVLALPFPPGQADQVVLSHVLEHVGKHDVLPALLEARRALRVGGTVTIEVPDLEYCVRLWVNTPEPHRWGFPTDAIYGAQTHSGQFHKTGFTRERLIAVVERAGLLVEEASGGTSHGVDVIRLLARRPPPFESLSDIHPNVRLEDDRELGRGWWEVEQGSVGSFRWISGNSTAFLHAPAAGLSRLRFSGLASCEHVPGGKLTVSLHCDGRHITDIAITESGAFGCLAELPPVCAAEEFHVVHFQVKPTFYVPGDERQLGVIVQELGLCE